MINDPQALAMSIQVYDHYGHNYDKIPSAAYRGWRHVHAQYNLSQRCSEAAFEKMKTEYPTIKRESDLLHLYTVVVKGLSFASKEAKKEWVAKCQYCRDSGVASRLCPGNRASTESVACFCEKGRSWAENCPTVVRSAEDMEAHEDVIFYHSFLESKASEWADDNGLKDLKGREFTEKWLKICGRRSGQMFQNITAKVLNVDPAPQGELVMAASEEWEY